MWGKLIASQFTDVYDDGSESPASATLARRPDQESGDTGSGVNEEKLDANVGATDAINEPHAIRFQAINAETNAPIAKCVYILTRENGVQHGGITDREGFTETIETGQQEQIAVHFAFTSPLGDVIDWEDLS